MTRKTHGIPSVEMVKDSKYSYCQKCRKHKMTTKNMRFRKYVPVGQLPVMQEQQKLSCGHFTTIKQTQL